MPSPLLIESPDLAGGIALSKGERNTKPNENVRSRNMRYTVEGGTVTNLGYGIPTGQDIGESGEGIDGLFTPPNYPELILTAVNGKIKLMVGDNATAYNVDPALTITAGNRVKMGEYRGNVYFANGVEDMGRIPISKLTAQLTTTPSDSVVNIRTTGYVWTVSNLNVNYYYLQATGATNPYISEPTRVTENNVAMTQVGSPSVLAAGEWAYGNGDNLSYNTVYVRLSDSSDPDGKADGYVEAEFDNLMSLDQLAGSRFRNAADKVYIDGDEIDYAGVMSAGEADQLYEVSNIATTHEVDSYVTQYNTLTAPPSGSLKARTFAFFRDTMWYIPADEPSMLRYGKTVDSFATIGNIHDFSDGENYVIGEGGELTALHATRDRLYVFLKDRIHYVGIEINSSGVEGFSPDRLFSPNYGCPNPFCVDEMEDVTIVFTGKRVIRIGYSPDNDQILPDEKFDMDIIPELSRCDQDQTRASVKYNPVEKKLRVSFMVDGILQTAVYDNQVKKWSYPDDEDVSQWMVFKGKTYFGNPDDDEIFRMGIDLNANGVEVIHEYKTGRMDAKTRLTKRFIRGMVEGKMASGTTISFSVFVNGKIVGGVRTIDNTHLISGASGTPVGDNVFGSDSVGDGGAATLLFPFRYPFLISSIGEDIQLKFSSFIDGGAWLIDKYRLEGVVYDNIPYTHY